jgi:hypothetical protein
MIDERLEWAHQDRMRSDSRDGSPPRSPFHEYSPFYAEFARHTGATPPPNEDRSSKTMPAHLAHGPKAQSFTCGRMGPFTSKPCNTVFSRRSDLAKHEDDIHNNRGVRRHACGCCPIEPETFDTKSGLRYAVEPKN